MDRYNSTEIMKNSALSILLSYFVFVFFSFLLSVIFIVIINIAISHHSFVPNIRRKGGEGE